MRWAGVYVWAASFEIQLHRDANFFGERVAMPEAFFPCMY